MEKKEITLRDLREQSGWRREAIAEELGITVSQLMKSEKAMRALSGREIILLAKLYGTSLDVIHRAIGNSVSFRPESLGRLRDADLKLSGRTNK